MAGFSLPKEGPATSVNRRTFGRELLLTAVDGSTFAKERLFTAVDRRTFYKVRLDTEYLIDYFINNSWIPENLWIF